MVVHSLGLAKQFQQVDSMSSNIVDITLCNFVGTSLSKIIQHCWPNIIQHCWFNIIQLCCIPHVAVAWPSLSTLSKTIQCWLQQFWMLDWFGRESSVLIRRIVCKPKIDVLYSPASTHRTVLALLCHLNAVLCSLFAQWICRSYQHEFMGTSLSSLSLNSVGVRPSVSAWSTWLLLSASATAGGLL